MFQGSIPEINTGHQLLDVAVTGAVVVIGIARGVTWLRDLGWLPSRENGRIKRLADMTVDSFEKILRHGTRSEMQVIGVELSKLQETSQQMLLTLVKIQTILEQQHK